MTTLNNVHIRQTIAALKLLKTFGTGRAAIVVRLLSLIVSWAPMPPPMPEQPPPICSAQDRAGVLRVGHAGRNATLFSNLSEYSSHCTPDFIRAESSLRGEGYWLWSVFVSPGGLLRDRQSGQRLSTQLPRPLVVVSRHRLLHERQDCQCHQIQVASQIVIATPKSRPLVVARAFPLSLCLSHGAFAAAIIVWDERQCGTNTKEANAASPILARGHPECGMRSIINAISNVP
ncbi:hypothetical protein OOU_Y34scaffold01083g3 [Pyricularia oryzae Y34]|uniref:Uncharacterized protein n=2 Tax=Pyricularia oryzae TaxID=318829 RepID=A0AA97NM01_PYRO3|nr:hypothetical protein OOU_Y34scaffold01083g3 [Pyricularia oryzae Y34]